LCHHSRRGSLDGLLELLGHLLEEGVHLFVGALGVDLGVDRARIGVHEDLLLALGPGRVERDRAVRGETVDVGD